MTDQTLEQQRDELLREVTSKFTQSSAEKLQLAVRAEKLCQRYEEEGGTGTQRWFCAENDVIKSNYYTIREAGKGSLAGLRPSKPDRAFTDCYEGWRMIERKQGEGVPMQQALDVAQQAIDTGTVGIRNRNAKRGLEGLAELHIPDIHAPLLRDQAVRIATLARRSGHDDAPTTGPEQLGFLAQVVQALTDPVWEQLLAEMA